MKDIEELARRALEMKQKGISDKEIATELHVSTQTVEWLLLRGFERKISAPKDIKIGWRSIGVYPYRISKIADIFADIVFEESQRNNVEISSVVGIAINGIPLATFLAEAMNYELIIYRPNHGNNEGTFSSNFANVANKNVVIVDDVISTGETMSKAIKDVRKNGGVPVLGLVIVNKTSKDEIEGIPVRSLIRARLIE